jgi:type IV secretion system protein TrbI
VGTLIPAVLETWLNSDVAGPMVALVQERVYGSLTGTHVLIPQGALLVGRYHARVV